MLKYLKVKVGRIDNDGNVKERKRKIILIYSGHHSFLVSF